MEFAYVSRLRREECESCPLKAMYHRDRRYVLCKYETVSSLLERRDELKRMFGERAMEALKEVEERLANAYSCPYS